MKTFFRDVPLFVEVAKHRSFTRAAEMLDMPLSTLSRRILSTEKALGIPLFHRGGRSIELTEYGKILYERCQTIVNDAEAMLEEVQQGMQTAKGPVRVAMGGDVYYTYMEGVLSQFAKQWPDIQLHINFSSREVDLYSEPYDLDLRAGIMADSTLKARRLLAMHTSLYASPELLVKYGIPKDPSDMKKFPCITMSQHGGLWAMSKGKRKENVNVQVAHSVNTASLAREFALAGLGAVWLVPPMVQKYEIPGALVNILPGWSIMGVELHVAMANRQLPHRVRLFVNCLVEYFAHLAEHEKQMKPIVQELF